MKIDLLKILRCPCCLGLLTLTPYEEETPPGTNILVGLLSCNCGAKYAIWQGVPRMFLPEEGLPPEFMDAFAHRLKVDAPDLLHIKKGWTPDKFSFSQEWSLYRWTELTWELTLAERVAYFYHYIEENPATLKDALVLDAGCGNGTLSAALAASGLEVIAMDYSNSVEQAELFKSRFAGENVQKIHYVQGDVQNPPFAHGTFDVIYCDGVLHHTPNTRLSFASLTPLVKVGGKMFIWVYRRDLSLSHQVKSVIVEIIRKLLRPFPLKIVRTLCFCGAVILIGQLRLRHLLGFRSRRIIPIWLKTINLFDTFTPRYNHLHTPDEVKSWFVKEGFLHPVETTITELGYEGFGIVGTREVTKPLRR